MNKVFTVTTDNRSNMVKAIKYMPNIIRIPCMAHILQLAIRKGLLDAEHLISYAKRLILFFTTPKQTERLIDAQKNLHQFESIKRQRNNNDDPREGDK